MPYTFKNKPVDYEKPLKVSGFYISNDATGTPLLEPFPYNTSLTPFSGESGISYYATAASGQFFSATPQIAWSLIDPQTERPFTPEQLNASLLFRGFDVSLLDETGMLVQEVVTGYKGVTLNLDVDKVKNLFARTEGDPAYTAAHGVGKDPRKMRVKVVSNDYYGRQHTGEYYLAYHKI
jgi:hypothetical protein